MFDFEGGRATNLILNSAVASRKYVHSWLFCGDELDLLNELAKKFAMAICCEGESKPCFKCENCCEFLKGLYVDFMQLHAVNKLGKSSFTVEQARNLIDKMHGRPLKGEFLIFLICGVDDLPSSCSNVFLKILEEPPKNTILLLSAKNHFKVLPTISSRCRMVKVADLGETKCEEILSRQFSNLKKFDLKQAVHFGDGFLGRSRRFLQNSLWQDGLKVATNLFEAYLKKNELLFLSLVAKLESDVLLVEVVFYCFSVLLRDMLHKSVHEAVDVDEVWRVFSCFEQAKVSILSNCNLKLVLSNLSCSIFAKLN